jgi:predicted ATPase
MAFPNAEILEFSHDGIKSVDYKETEHFKVTKGFLDNPDKMLHYLLDENIV